MNSSVERTRVGKFELGKTLGEGTFAKVKVARDINTGLDVAIKILDKEKILKHKMVEQIKREISTMKLVKHPYVVQLLEVGFVNSILTSSSSFRVRVSQPFNFRSLCRSWPAGLRFILCWNMLPVASSSIRSYVLQHFCFDLLRYQLSTHCRGTHELADCSG